MKILVTGAQFTNKGAQSLLFTVMDQFRKHYGDVDVFYMPLDNYKKYDDSFRFEVVYGGNLAHQYENEKLGKVWIPIKVLIRNMFREPIPVKDIKRLHTVLPTIDALIDVSGYQLSSKWSLSLNERFLNQIEEAKKYKAKVILMPQSFGPFDYGENQSYMDSRITETLSKVDLIFAREKTGKDVLEKKYHLNNIKLSTDFVLQSPDIDSSNIFRDEPVLNVKRLDTKHNVGIVPNFQTVTHGDKNTVLEIYHLIIDRLIKRGKNIYIFRHSEDLDLCKQIYEGYEKCDQVILIENDFNSIEYSEFVNQFDFIVASRYHAVVHAYKQLIPCFILGWSEKYIELAKIFNQEGYIYDLTNFKMQERDLLLSALDNLSDKFDVNSNLIALKLKEIQEKSCLSLCWDILDK